MSSKESASPSPPVDRIRQIHATPLNDDVVIRFSRVRKAYRLYQNDIGRFIGGFLGGRANPYLSGTRVAADDLSFEIRKGESVAFLGRNGMGKSTTLKMISGLAFPNSGAIQVNGRISALLELTAGFDNELTGRENIRIRGLIMGMNDEELAAVEGKVVEFAELDLYMDQPLRTYSSGMRARLGFAFAVAIDPEILIVDEALSVGDKSFQQKCKARIREIMADENVTVLLVTHSAPVARELCARGIVLDQGVKMFDGPIGDAIAYYEANY